MRFAGRTATTTEKVLNPLYELEPNSEKRVMAGLDLKKAPKGSCVNRSPIVQIVGPGGDSAASADTIPTLTARVGAALILNGEVQDDGLPRDSKLIVSWKKTARPRRRSRFRSTDTASTRATFGSPGEYELELIGERRGEERAA